MESKRTKRVRIADHAVAVLKERGLRCVQAGDGPLLDLIGIRAGMRYMPAVLRWRNVLKGLTISDQFQKELVPVGPRSIRRFTLVEQPTPAEQP